MFNYENEIKRTRDKYLNSMIGCDYFHDSIVKELRFENAGRDLFLVLSCEREWTERLSFSDCQKTDTYDYELHFRDCRYVESNINYEKEFIEYLNARFKNSAKLKNLSKSTRKNYYHLRIQMCEGVIDVIFHEFAIRKIKGSIEIPKHLRFINHFDALKKRLDVVDIDVILHIAQQGEDYEKSLALEYLWYTGYEKSRELAIDALVNADEYDFTWMSAIFVLGETGKLEDIGLIARYLKTFEKGEYIGMLHVRDAIDKIVYRFNC